MSPETNTSIKAVMLYLSIYSPEKILSKSKLNALINTYIVEEYSPDEYNLALQAVEGAINYALNS